MLNTSFNQDFSFSTSDSTVYINQGIARVGNNILPFRGDNLQFQQMVDFGDQTNVYQYSALLLQNFNSYSDLTSAVSTPADTTHGLTYPALIPDSTVFPIGLFLFYTSDGSAIELISSQRINS
jgi:glutathionylspermidine synthase